MIQYFGIFYSFCTDLIVNVDDLTHGQKAELNNFGTKYGLGVGDFMEYLNGDLEEKEKLRLAKLQEEEKQAMSVCKFYNWYV